MWASLCKEGAAQVRYHADKSGPPGKQESDEAIQVHRAATRCNENDGDYLVTEITKQVRKGVFTSSLPVLLMEWMFNSLHAFMKDPANISFSLAKKASILCDVACGLAYLHSHTPAIIHRDLSNCGSEGYFIIKNNYNSRQDTTNYNSTVTKL